MAPLPRRRRSRLFAKTGLHSKVIVVLNGNSCGFRVLSTFLYVSAKNGSTNMQALLGPASIYPKPSMQSPTPSTSAWVPEHPSRH
jgi:hypothetical protein